MLFSSPSDRLEKTTRPDKTDPHPPAETGRPIRFLHLEDCATDVELVKMLLEAEWPECRIDVVDTRPAFTEQLGAAHDIILSDFTLGSFDGLEALKLARQSVPDIPFIFVSGSIGEERAIEAVRGGAHDYVLKDRMKRLITSIRRALADSEEARRRHQAEEAHRQLLSILETTPDLIGVMGLDGTLSQLNGAGRRMLGIDERGELPPLALRDLYPPFAAPAMVAQILPAAIQSGVWWGETQLKAADGRTLPVSQIVLAHKDAGGKVQYLSTVIRDLSSSKEAESRIRELAGVIQKCREAITVTDLDQRFTFWNEGAVHLTGLDATAALGRTEREVFASVSRPQDPYSAVMEQGEWRGELTLGTHQGRQIVLDEHLTLIRDDSGRPKAILRVAADITERKAMEEQVLRAQRVEALGMMAAGIAHDLNNVLTPIAMGAPLVRQRSTDPSVSKLVGAMERSAERGTALVRQILTFARGSAGERSRIQLDHLVREIAVLVAQTFPKTIAFEWHLPVDLWEIEGHATQMHHVLVNLCVNARDAMPGGGKLIITAGNVPVGAKGPGGKTTPIPCVRLEVQDTGTGIEPEILERVWEPFYTTKDGRRGTGLGLATVRGIVESHGGAVEVKSEKGCGTTFIVHLPSAPAEG